MIRTIAMQLTILALCGTLQLANAQSNPTLFASTSTDLVLGELAAANNELEFEVKPLLIFENEDLGFNTFYQTHTLALNQCGITDEDLAAGRVSADVLQNYINIVANLDAEHQDAAVTATLEDFDK
ncbi:MAG: hypothetical protein ACPGXL_04595 [Chitinophagales bacterium]